MEKTEKNTKEESKEKLSGIILGGVALSDEELAQVSGGNSGGRLPPDGGGAFSGC